MRIDMCDCPAELVNSIVCNDGTLLTLPINDADNPAGLAELHADLVATHGGLRAHDISCPDCGRVYHSGIGPA